MSGSSSLRHLLNPERQTPPPPTTTTHEDNPGSYQPRDPSLSTSDSDPDDFLFLEDSEDDQASAEMPPSTRNTARRHSVVDLTETPDAQSSSRRRKRSDDEGPPRKRGRITRQHDEAEIDLEDENPSAEEELRQAQQQATIRAQQAEVDAGPRKIGKLQCIICMESYTNATATACGHFYCHECLHQSLLVGERAEERKGTCPVCRKFISRKKKHEIIPISFMKKATFLKQKGKA